MSRYILTACVLLVLSSTSLPARQWRDGEVHRVSTLQTVTERTVLASFPLRSATPSYQIFGQFVPNTDPNSESEGSCTIVVAAAEEIHPVLSRIGIGFEAEHPIAFFGGGLEEEDWIQTEAGRREVFIGNDGSIMVVSEWQIRRLNDDCIIALRAAFHPSRQRVFERGLRLD